MPDIFVSYSHDDRGRVAEIVTKLEKNAWSVWWDPHIMPGERYAQSIDEQLKSAKCVMAIWSQQSAESDWVQEEAEDGKARGVLLPVLLDDVPIPRGFRRIQAVDLSDWSGDEKDPAWAYVVAAAKRYITGGPPPAIKPPKTRRQRRGARIANTIIALLLAVIAGGVYWGATHPAQLTQITQNNTFVQSIVNIFTSGDASEASTGAAGTVIEPPAAGARGENEPNESTDTATRIALGREVAGEITTKEDNDVYRLETTPGPRNELTFRIDNDSAELSPQLRILNGNGSQVFNAYDRTRGADLENKLMAAPGETLYAAVTEYGIGRGGAYRLTVSNDTRHTAAARVENGQDEREPNDQSLDAMEIEWGRPVFGHAHRNGDEDFYVARAPASAAGMVNIRVRSFSREFSPYLTIYDENREQIDHWYTTTPGADLAGPLEVAPASTYYFGVNGFSESAGDYVLEFGAN